VQPIARAELWHWPDGLLLQTIMIYDERRKEVAKQLPRARQSLEERFPMEEPFPIIEAIIAAC